ncbi:YraN family protein [Stenotrophomonas rhizophila]|uniref:YraN family protein n=1 Tax=Stenotrophomonas rhizophila TaxID=216778 RepID=UPI001E593517|nr:YraN family protein [Stenotrophomonas rhizophila]MCC7636069.1 YraN family protein [Stenotrophomonas rhizophila]MCC7662705.1 YraN family protein [Stenotrophomonas rhizophila]
MPSERARRGAAVETAAQAYLRQAGLSPISRNARYRGGELDLIMRDGETTVFVEVRYRASAGFGGGAASVDLRKRRKLVLAAQLFLAAHPDLAERPCRFDVIDASGDPPQLHWLRDAFRLEDC